MVCNNSDFSDFCLIPEGSTVQYVLNITAETLIGPEIKSDETLINQCKSVQETLND